MAGSIDTSAMLINDASVAIIISINNINTGQRGRTRRNSKRAGDAAPEEAMSGSAVNAFQVQIPSYSRIGGTEIRSS